jgi:hypothetical protein
MEKETPDAAAEHRQRIAYRFLLAIFADIDGMPPASVKQRVLTARELWAKYIDTDAGQPRTDQQPTYSQPNISQTNAEN